MARAIFGRRAKPPSLSGSFVERRNSQRQRVFTPASIVVEGGVPGADCLIRDISSTGAGLCFAALAKLPARFRLVHGAGARICRLVWQSGLDAGVAFEEALSA